MPSGMRLRAVLGQKRGEEKKRGVWGTMGYLKNAALQEQLMVRVIQGRGVRC